MTRAPLVSAIVPAYNAERFIGQAVDSILAQTYKPIEVIVVDDGSTDRTPSILAGYGSSITVIRQANLGLAAARNRAVSAAQGDYVALIDADDRWAPTKIAQQVAVLETHPAYALVHTRRRVIDDDGQVIKRPDLPPVEGRCLAALVRLNGPIAVSSVLVRRSVLGPTPFAHGIKGCEDWDLWLRLAASYEIGYLANTLTDYRRHAGNMSGSNRLMLASSIEVLTRFIDRTEEKTLKLDGRILRHRLQLALAHYEYESGDYERARQMFRVAGRPLGRDELIRLASCYLPAHLRHLLRSTWRTLQVGAAPLSND